MNPIQSKGLFWLERELGISQWARTTPKSPRGTFRRKIQLADFIEQASVTYAFDQKNLLGVGYSNGTNIASSLMLLRPSTLISAALLRPMVPIVPETLPDLRGTSVLVAAGQYDPIAPVQEARNLADLLRT